MIRILLAIPDQYVVPIEPLISTSTYYRKDCMMSHLLRHSEVKDTKVLL